MGFDLIVKRITGWEDTDDVYAPAPYQEPITEDVGWWDRGRLAGRKDFWGFINKNGQHVETVYEEDCLHGYCWVRLKDHGFCRNWVHSQPGWAEGNKESLIQLIDESEKDSNIVMRGSW